MKARLPEGVQMKRGDMMKQLQNMQQQMEQTQAQVEESEFSATAGGGMVTAVVNGKKELLSVKIDPEVVDPDDVEMLEDLITKFFTDFRRCHGESLVSTLTLNLECLVIRITCEEFLNTLKSIFLNRFKIAFELSGKTYGNNTEYLTHCLHYLFC